MVVPVAAAAALSWHTGRRASKWEPAATEGSAGSVRRGVGPPGRMSVSRSSVTVPDKAAEVAVTSNVGLATIALPPVTAVAGTVAVIVSVAVMS